MTIAESITGHAIDAFIGKLDDAIEQGPELPEDCKTHHHARLPYPMLWEHVTNPDGDIGTRVLFAAMLRANENGYARFKRGELVSWLKVRNAGSGKVVPADGRRVSRAIASHIRSGTFGPMSDRQVIDLRGLALNGARKGAT